MRINIVMFSSWKLPCCIGMPILLLAAMYGSIYARESKRVVGTKQLWNVADVRGKLYRVDFGADMVIYELGEGGQAEQGIAPPKVREIVQVKMPGRLLGEGRYIQQVRIAAWLENGLIAGCRIHDRNKRHYEYLWVTHVDGKTSASRTGLIVPDSQSPYDVLSVSSAEHLGDTIDMWLARYSADGSNKQTLVYMHHCPRGDLDGTGEFYSVVMSKPQVVK